MKKIIISILLALLAGIGGTAYISKSPNVGSFGNNLSLVSMTSATTSVPVGKRSIWHAYATSSEAYSQIWFVSSSTDGTPWTIVSQNTGRLGLELYGSAGRTWFWIVNSTTTNMNVSSSTNGWILEQGKTWNMKDYGVILPGTVYGIAALETGTSTVAYKEFR